jgi:hypothetical protein
MPFRGGDLSLRVLVSQRESFILMKPGKQISIHSSAGSHQHAYLSQCAVGQGNGLPSRGLETRGVAKTPTGSTEAAYRYEISSVESAFLNSRCL